MKELRSDFCLIYRFIALSIGLCCGAGDFARNILIDSKGMFIKQISVGTNRPPQINDIFFYLDREFAIFCGVFK